MPVPASMRHILPLALTLFACQMQVFGLGSRIPNQDATAIGRGNAFVATADNPSAMYYNPAGITQLEGQNFQVGSLFYLGIDADYESPSGASVKNNRYVIPVPQMGYVYTPESVPLSFGLGVYAPFGLGMEWPDNAPFASAGIQANITYITINPVVAWKILPCLSIAVGPTFNYSDAKLRQQVVAPPIQLRFTGSDWAYGYNAGILWQPLQQWSFGAKYFSQTSFDYKGDASFNPQAPGLPAPFDTKAHLDFPMIVAGGVSFRPTPDWNIEVDVDWTEWDRVKTVVIDNVGVLPLYWQSSFFYEFGVTRQLGGGYFASVGYFFSQASTPDKYFTPLVPDTDLHVGSLGFGYKGGHWDFALASQIIGGGWRTVTDAANPTVDGRWRLFTPTLSVSVGYHF